MKPILFISFNRERRLKPRTVVVCSRFTKRKQKPFRAGENWVGAPVKLHNQVHLRSQGLKATDTTCLSFLLKSLKQP